MWLVYFFGTDSYVWLWAIYVYHQDNDERQRTIEVVTVFSVKLMSGFKRNLPKEYLSLLLTLQC